MNNGNKLTTYLLAGTLGLIVATGTTQAATLQKGEVEFKEYCASCHADGGNIVNPAKTLSKKDREMNGVKTAKDIIKIIRSPGEGMSMFDEKTLPETEAGNIAEYILKTF